jgi:hypothetical protein
MSISELHMTVLGQQGLDPVIFMRLLRVVLFSLGAVLMLIEPMACGGKNQVFHRMLAILLATGAWSSWSQAMARMAIVVADPIHFFETVPPGHLFWPEFAYTVAAIVVAGRLLYDTYLFARLRTFGINQDCGKVCRVTDTHLHRGGR